MFYIPLIIVLLTLITKIYKKKVCINSNFVITEYEILIKSKKNVCEFR